MSFTNSQNFVRDVAVMFVENSLGDKTVFITHSFNTFEKGMNPTFLSPSAIGK